MYTQDSILKHLHCCIINWSIEDSLAKIACKNEYVFLSKIPYFTDLSFYGLI